MWAGSKEYNLTWNSETAKPFWAFLPRARVHANRSLSAPPARLFSPALHFLRWAVRTAHVLRPMGVHLRIAPSHRRGLIYPVHETGTGRTQGMSVRDCTVQFIGESRRFPFEGDISGIYRSSHLPSSNKTPRRRPSTWLAGHVIAEMKQRDSKLRFVAELLFCAKSPSPPARRRFPRDNHNPSQRRQTASERESDLRRRSKPTRFSSSNGTDRHSVRQSVSQPVWRQRSPLELLFPVRPRERRLCVCGARARYFRFTEEFLDEISLGAISTRG